MNIKNPTGWFWRRLMAYAMAAFCMTMMTYLAWYGIQDGQLHQLIAEICGWLMGAIFLIYVGAATIDQLVSVLRAFRGLPDKEGAK